MGAERGAAPEGVTKAEVEAALDAWFTRPDWREVYADGPPVRDYMRRALNAARRNADLGAAEEVGRLTRERDEARQHAKDLGRMLIWDEDVLKGPERLRLDRRIRDQRMSIRSLWRVVNRLRQEAHQAEQRAEAAVAERDAATARAEEAEAQQMALEERLNLTLEQLAMARGAMPRQVPNPALAAQLGGPARGGRATSDPVCQVRATDCVAPDPTPSRDGGEHG